MPASCDIVVYGATSFVAKHVFRYFLEVSNTIVDQTFTVSLGGRSKAKMEALRKELKEEENGKAVIKDIFIASGEDFQALKTMAKNCKVVLNCAGPFAKYASKVVEACAEVGTDYVDITAEVIWVAEMRQKFGGKAKKSGARIVSFCGYDSIPTDLSVFASVQALKDKFGDTSVEAEEATVWVHPLGMANGGTIHTAVEIPVDLKNDLFKNASSGSKWSLRKVPYFIGDPLLLTHPTKVRHNPDFESRKDRLAWGEWINQLVHIDRNFSFGVSLPFVMSPVNLKVVHASSVALNYGKNFTANERWIPLGFRWTRVVGIFAFFPLLFFHMFFLAFAGLFKIPVLGKKFLDWVAPPGSGVPDWACNIGYHEMYATVTATPEAGTPDHLCNRAYTFMNFTGDPGNLITAQCVCESALSLVLNRKDLPERSEDGFGTPSEILGQVLLKRLKETKVRPIEFRTIVRKNTPRKEIRLYTS